MVIYLFMFVKVQSEINIFTTKNNHSERENSYIFTADLVKTHESPIKEDIVSLICYPVPTQIALLNCLA